MSDNEDQSAKTPATDNTTRIPRLKGGAPKKASDKNSSADKAGDKKASDAQAAETKAADSKTTVKPVAEKKSAAKKSTSKKSGSSKADSTESKTAESDKGSKKDSVAASAKQESSPRGKSDGQTMTAGDYARTTGGRPDQTAVIPAVRDDWSSENKSSKDKAAKPAKPAKPSTTEPPASSTSGAGGRRAELRLLRIEPWSVTKLAFVVSVALMIVAVVAVTIFWIVLDLTGVWDQLNGSVTNVLSDSSDSFDVTSYLGLPRLIGLTLIMSAINVVVMTALATIAAHLYNLAAQLLGGIELTFGDD